jgi:hypothetical protein
VSCNDAGDHEPIWSDTVTIDNNGACEATFFASPLNFIATLYIKKNGVYQVGIIFVVISVNVVY